MHVIEQKTAIEVIEKLRGLDKSAWVSYIAYEERRPSYLDREEEETEQFVQRIQALQDQNMKEALVIWGFVNNKISLGKAGELLHLDYEQIKTFLHSKGINSNRPTPVEQKSVRDNNLKEEAERLGIKI